MRIGRAILIPAIFALSTAGPILAGSAAPVTAAQTATVHVLATDSSMGTNLFYHS